MNLFKVLFAASVAATLSVSAFAGYGTLTIGDEAYLPSCGGVVSITKSPQGNNGEQVNVVFRGVENCSKFDIVAKDGFDLRYAQKKLGGTQGNYSGSFTLPKRVVEYGLNNVTVVVQSNSKAHQDTINIRFREVSIPNYPRSYPTPAPANDPVIVPSSGNGGY